MILPVPEEQLSFAEKCLWEAVCMRDDFERALLAHIKEMADPASSFSSQQQLRLIYELCSDLQKHHERIERRDAIERMVQYTAFPEPPTLSP
jgi:hypothetical protein